jgi:cell division protein YceG involved in septum cleavage
LRASSRPDITGELFFVATGLPDGSHVFSRTYAAHRKAVQAMLARQRAGAGERTAVQEGGT